MVTPLHGSSGKSWVSMSFGCGPRAGRSPGRRSIRLHGLFPAVCVPRGVCAPWCVCRASCLPARPGAHSPSMTASEAGLLPPGRSH